ncbi:MAG TPA: heme-binding protein [Steroidobacteraceae bacterium]
METIIRTKYLLNLSEAQTIVSAAQAHANRSGWAITVAVVDDSGTPIIVSRLDEASPSSVNTAIEKARSAANTGLPTKVLEAMIRERPGIVTLGRVAVEGGLPILYKGQRVGGVGVSGVKSDQDAEVAQAGLQALDLNS